MFYIYLKFDKNGQLYDKRDYFNFAIINFTHLLHIFNIVTCYSEEQVISMLEFLIDSIFVFFGGTLFQQVVGIPMGTDCAPLLADLRLEPLISHTGILTFYLSIILDLQNFFN